MHDAPHPLAGQEVTLTWSGQRDAHRDAPTARVDDWWDRAYGSSWMTAVGNPAALQYAMRSALDGLPADDEVVYVKVDGLGHLVHVSELGAPA